MRAQNIVRAFDVGAVAMHDHQELPVFEQRVVFLAVFVFNAADGQGGNDAATDEASVREWMSGNICRCSAYPQITAAVLAAAREGAGQ